MKFGPIVDGQAEFRSLPHLIPRIACKHTILSPLRADIQPHSPIPRIVQAVKSRLDIQVGRGADAALILIDRETRSDCTGIWASQIQVALAKGCADSGIHKFAVVVKNRMFENWLVSDIEALARMTDRFKFSQSQIDSIQPNKADQVDSLSLLRSAAIKQSYDKVQDSVRIMRIADALRMAANSRSFRKFLRVVGSPDYGDQSKKPAVTQ